MFSILLLVYIVAITVSEMTTTLVSPVLGTALHIITLVALIVSSAMRRELSERRMLMAMALVPLTRVLSMSLPLAPVEQIYWYPIIYAPLLAGTIVVARIAGYSARDIGLAPGKYYPILVMAAVGVALGVIEHHILTPVPLVASLSFSTVALPAVMLLLSTGLVEELIFRGVLQTAAVRVLGNWGILFVSFLFAILHIGFLSVADFLFVFAVALLFAWVVMKTGSLYGVVLAHGLTNIMLYLIAPFIFR